jgi:DNA-directed RNA polymerase specialized sigma24 family protein
VIKTDNKVKSLMDENSKRLLEQFKQGNKAAADELFAQYFDRTVRAARRRIARRPTAGVESEDIALSAFESIWKKADQMQFDRFDLQDSNEFWRLLCTIIRFKAEQHVRKAHAKKRGGGRVFGESVFSNLNADHSTTPGIGGYKDDGFTPHELVAFKDGHAKFMQVLQDAVLAEIATLRMEDHTVSEIAAHFGKSDRWVKRKLALIRQIWSEEIQKNAE